MDAIQWQYKGVRCLNMNAESLRDKFLQDDRHCLSMQTEPSWLRHDARSGLPC